MSRYKKLMLNGTDFPKYESPIQVLFDEPLNPLITAMENAIVAQVSQTLHIKIDKDELTKALAYDRGQYEKGYMDALAGFEQPTVDAVQVVRCGECEHRKPPTDYCEKLCKAYIPDDFYCKYGERKNDGTTAD